MAMELTDEFVVPLAVADAWKLLTDVERIAPCLPGTRSSTRSSTASTPASVRVQSRTRPAVQYKGTARFTELDEAAHRLVLSASGKRRRALSRSARRRR